MKAIDVFHFEIKNYFLFYVYVELINYITCVIVFNVIDKRFICNTVTHARPIQKRITGKISPVHTCVIY